MPAVLLHQTPRRVLTVTTATTLLMGLALTPVARFAGVPRPAHTAIMCPLTSATRAPITPPHGLPRTCPGPIV